MMRRFIFALVGAAIAAAALVAPARAQLPGVFNPLLLATSEGANSNFNIVTWTGTGSSIAVTGLGFQPDLCWIKSTSNTDNWGWYDSYRGVQKKWTPNTASAQSTDANGLTAFGSDGFTVGTSHSVSGYSYIAFCWKKGTAQFDLVGYTGNGTSSRLLSHALGVQPGLIFSKTFSQGFEMGANGVNARPTTTGYFMTVASANPGMFTAGASTSSTQWNPAQPAYDNVSGDATSLGTLFGAAAGNSAQGNYTGNGSASGPTVSLGFKPKFLMIKIVGTGDWYIINGVRSPSNPAIASLRLNNSSAESGALSSVDLNASGFQIKSATLLNTNASSYFYMAFR